MFSRGNRVFLAATAAAVSGSGVGATGRRQKEWCTDTSSKWQQALKSS